MNQDFTVPKKRQNLSEKKFEQRGSPKKKIPAQAVSEKKKKFVQAENSAKHPTNKQVKLTKEIYKISYVFYVRIY